MDFRRFLGKQEEQVLPYFGGATVDAPGRELRVEQRVEPGWWRFQIEGRKATALEPAEPELDSQLPKLRGHLIDTRLVDEAGRVRRLWFLPEDEPPLFAPVTAHRWHSGDVLFGALEFEDEAEEAARQALEEGRSLAEVKAVPSSLRAAFAFALVEAQGRALGIPVSPLEVRGAVAEVAEGGPERATRRRTQRVLAAAAVDMATLDADQARVAAALTGTAARLLRLRRLAGEQLEVTYSFLGNRFQSIVDARTLNVVDAGVCLDGEDGALTLESLPGVIREAVDTGQLVITRQVSHDG